MAIKDLNEKELNTVKEAMQTVIGNYDRQLNTGKQSQLVKNAYQQLKTEAQAIVAKLETK